MNESTRLSVKEAKPKPDSALSKYASLIHILNGEEEFVLDGEGIIISSNLEAVNVTGYDEFEVINKHISIFYLPDEESKAEADLAKARRVGNALTTGIRIKKRGVRFWAKMKIKAYEPFRTGYPAFKVVLQDVTHRALSRERIRTIKDEYLTIFNNPFIGTFKFRMDNYSIQMCNQKTLEIVGKQNSTDYTFESFFSSVQQFELFIAELKDKKRIEGFKFLVLEDESKGENWAVLSARYFESQGFVEGVVFDISEQYVQMLELQRVNAELDNFVYHASHDLRSPLTSILGLVNLGLRETISKNVETYLELIKSRVNHLDVLLRDLISVSYNNGVETASHFVYFEEEVHALLKTMDQGENRFKITTTITQHNDFKTDPIRIRTILRNVLSNSFKYFNPVVAEPCVDLNICVTATHCDIRVTDNGIGINPTLKSRVFDMFFRATERSTGTGLGLYIVKSMVEKLNGKVTLESNPNEGTTLQITIPNQTVNE